MQGFLLIKLDWDNIAYYTCKKRINEIKKFESPKGDGYHIYIKENYPLSFKEKIHYRNIWKDDGKRVNIDLLKIGNEPTDVMFKYKIQRGIKYKEIFIEEITL